MRISVVLSDLYPADVAPVVARDSDRALVAALAEPLSGCTLVYGGTVGRWNMQPLTALCYLSASAGALDATVLGLPLGVLNPVELAEQLATVDHSWGGRFRAGLTVGTSQQLATHGIDPTSAPARFGEALALLRAMWSEPALAGSGPHFAFGEVQPTLRPVRPGGPPLVMSVSDPDDARRAVELDLGIAVERGAGHEQRLRLLAGYRADGGVGEVSMQLDASEVTAASLAELAAAGVDQVDVRPADSPLSPAALRDRVTELLARCGVAGGV